MKAFRAASTLLVLLIVGACTSSSWFGTADTPGQKAYQAMARYVYAATPAAEYAKLPSAQPGVVDVLRQLDNAAYKAVTAAAAAYQAGGDDLTAVLARADAALSDFSLQAIGSVEIPDDEVGLVSRGAVLAAVGARSAIDMRAWRKNFTAVLEQLAETGAEPSADAMGDVMDRAAGLHTTISGTD